MIPLTNPMTIFPTKEMAQKVADANAEDPDAIYAVVERNDGKFVVQVRDAETDEFIFCL